ncbi:MAG TPA: tyrosine-type recombinase/integrase [Candidatus Aquilonibacter sp.]|nr:tyrosine-type recombinase/integrase [Candidatus Aquilonibacter sp.]
MAYVWKHPKSPFWMAVYRNEQNQWRKKTTKKTVKTAALALAIEWERAAQLGRDKILTESISREVIGGILERTTGEKLRQSTVREFCAEWMRGKTNSRQAGTATRYESSVARFNELLGVKADRPISAVTPHDCQKFYDQLAERKLAPATMRVEMKTISSVFNFARRLGLIATNPAAAVQLPERIKQVKRKVFTPAQVQMLINEATPEWKTCVLLGYYAGLRLSDCVMLTWEAVDFAGEKLVVETHKTGETLEIPLHPTLKAHLSKLAGDTNGAICPALAAVPVGGRSGLSKQFLAIMRRAGIGNDAVDTGGQRQLSRLSFHALRASFNSTLHNKGVDQELRRKLTGHKSDAMNDRYTRTEMQTLRDAVNKLPALKS